MKKAKKRVEQLPPIRDYEFVRQYYGIDCDRKNYKTIALENNLSFTNVNKRIKGSIIETQIKVKSVPEKLYKYMQEFKEQILDGFIPDKDLDKAVSRIFSTEIAVPYKSVS